MKFMKNNIFVDSNIWLYAFMESKVSKKEIAINIIAKDNIV